MLDVPAHGGGGRRRERGKCRTFREDGEKFRDPSVRGTEILAPLGDAVGFIDADEGDVHPFCRLPEILCQQPLRREIEELRSAGMAVRGVLGGKTPKAAVKDGPSPGGRLSGREGRRRDAQRQKLLHLVVHEGDERRDDERDP